MKKVFISIVAVVTLVITANTANAQTPESFGHVIICGIANTFVPPVKSITDSRLPAFWTLKERTACIVRNTEPNPEVKLVGYCNPFPNKVSPVGEYTPFCQAGSNEKAHAYVCNTGRNTGQGCGATSAATYSLNNLPSGNKLSLSDVKSALGSNYKCGQMIQLDIFNKTCTSDMIYRHYQNVKNVPNGDDNGNGVANHFEPQYFVKDASGTPRFCLAKDAFVWYTGTCTTPNMTVDKFIDVSKTVGTAPYKTGDVIAFGITVKNTGNTNLVNIKLTDTIPAYTEFDSVKTQQLNGGALNWSCTSTTCTYSSLSLAVGESKTVYFAVKVKAYTTQGDIRSKNKVCASVASLAEKCDEVPFDIKDVLILKSIYIDKMIDASKTVGTAPYKANDVIAFHVRVKNTGNTKLENVVLKDVVPALTTFNAQATATLNAGIGVSKLWTCTGTNCSLAIGTLEANQTFDVYFAAKVNTYEMYGQDAKSDNTACVVTSSITGEKCDTVPFDLKDLIAPTKSITIVKTIEGTPKIYAAGEYVKFKVVVKNTGTTNLTNVVVTDPIPAYTSFDSAKTMEANGLGGFAWTCNTTTCTSNLGSMAAGATKTGYLVVKVKNYAIYDTDVKSENEACVVATPIDGRKCSKVTFDLKDLVNPTKSISIVKTIEGSKNQYEANDKIIFKVSVRNTGNSTLTNVVVTDDVPEYTSFDAAGTRAANSGNSYVWNCDNSECRVNIGTMESGATKTVFYAVKVNAYDIKDTDVKSENKACVVTTELPNERCSTVPFDLKDLEGPKASSITIDKTIDSSKSEGSAPYESLKSLVFKIVVTNDGETDLTDVKVTDDVPAHTTFDGAKTDSLSEGWSCEGQKCTNTIGSLEKGESVTLYYAVKIIDTTAVTTAIDSKNTACVVATGEDPSSLEKCDTVDFDIKDNEKPKEEDKEGSELSISKKVRKEGDDRWEDKITDVEEGDVIEFKIKVTNKSDEDTKSIDDLKMLDKLPKELEKLSGGLTEYWDDFEAGDDKTFTIKAKVRSSEFEGNVDKCVDNRAYVYKDKNEKDSDRATVCYSNVEVTELPETGAGLAMTLGGFITSAAGIVLKKKRA